VLNEFLLQFQLGKNLAVHPAHATLHLSASSGVAQQSHSLVYRTLCRTRRLCARELRHHDLFLINHPDLVEEVMVKKPRFFSKGRVMKKMSRVIGQGLLTSEGAYHMRQRRLAQPLFIASACKLTAK
jgi:cytochrome P450